MRRLWGKLLAIFGLLSCAGPGWAQAPVRINWTAVTGAQSGMFMAQQEGLFKKNGVDVELLHIPSSSRGIQAILAGEIAFSYMDGVNQVQANLKGANLAFVIGAAITPTPDPINQTIVSLPVYFLFELGVILARFA